MSSGLRSWRPQVAAAVGDLRADEPTHRAAQWLEASAAITRELLSCPDDARPSLRTMAAHTRELTGADVVLVLLPAGEAPDSDLCVATAAGPGVDALRAARASSSATVPGRVARDGRPVRVPFLGDRSRLLTSAVGPADDVGPLLAVPLRGSERVHGVLCALREPGRAAFGETDLAVAAALAGQGAVAIELAGARAGPERPSVLDDRQRIAADLHDHVIQRLFAAGLTLQTVVGRLPDGPVADRVAATIGTLDDTIRQIRTTILQLHQEGRGVDGGAGARLPAVVGEVAQALGFEPGLHVTGVLDDELPEPVVDDAVAVVREALTNVGRHARARSADVDVIVRGGRLTLVVTDDGVGIGRPGRSSGLANLRRRAEHHGGEFAVVPRRPAGTRLTWTVPLG